MFEGRAGMLSKELAVLNKGGRLGSREQEGTSPEGVA